MAEARTFNFNEVAQPEEKDFQVANKMLFKEGYDSAKPALNDAGAKDVGAPQTPNPASPQRDFAPPSEQKIPGYPTPQIDLFDGKKVAPAIPTPTPAPRAEQPKATRPKAEQAKDVPVIPTPTPAPRAEQPKAEQPKPARPAAKDPQHPDPSKAKPFSEHKPKEGHSLAPGECIRGIASHYGQDDGLYGRKTASGERLKPGLATIALPHYNNQREKPFQVVLHNTRTGQEIQARVNDMGPNLRLGRAADLESATFKRLFRNASGLAEITVCRPK